MNMHGHDFGHGGYDGGDCGGGYGGGCGGGGRIKRGILIGLLSIGTIGGFACGFHSMGQHCHARREAFERHVADVCVRAAHEAEATAKPEPKPDAEPTK